MKTFRPWGRYSHDLMDACRSDLGRLGYVVAGSDDGRFYVYDVATGLPLGSAHADGDIVNCVRPHPRKPWLATSGIDSGIRLWSPEPLRTSRQVRLRQHTNAAWRAWATHLDAGPDEAASPQSRGRMPPAGEEHERAFAGPSQVRVDRYHEDTHFVETRWRYLREYLKRNSTLPEHGLGVGFPMFMIGGDEGAVAMPGELLALLGMALRRGGFPGTESEESDGDGERMDEEDG